MHIVGRKGLGWIAEKNHITSDLHRASTHAHDRQLVNCLHRSIADIFCDLFSCLPISSLVDSGKCFIMTRNMRRICDFCANVYVAFLGSLASILALLWFVFERLNPSTLIWGITVPIAVICLFAIGIYSVSVRKENIHFRTLIWILHRINHTYRDALSSVFRYAAPTDNTKDSIESGIKLERDTLQSVCANLASLYGGFTHRSCTVTIKLITRSGGKAYCETYARSEHISNRDQGTPRLFEINTGANTAFDRAIMYVPGGKISHFYSADLTKEPDYHNQRDRWADYYRSVIVVPIRSVNPLLIGSKDGKDDIGFLCVDTLSENRLNDRWHLEMLAAFADQMYNFISLMRGNYALHKVANA